MTLYKNQSPILPLTSVRFFAAAYVVLHHCVAWTTGFHTSTWAGRFQRDGFVAVGFFFVLSGYILAHVYLNTDRVFQKRKFLISRFARIYPLLLVSLLLDVPQYVLRTLAGHGHYHVAIAIVRALPSAVLLQAWLGSRLLVLNAPSWSLSAEAFFYVLFPFLALHIWRRSRTRGISSILYLWLCAIGVPLLVTLLIPSLFVQVDTSDIQWVVTLNPLFRVFEFFAGVSLCSVQKTFAVGRTPELRSRAGYLAIGAGAVLFALTMAFSNDVPYLAMSNGMLLPVFVLVIFGLVNIRGWLALALSHKWMVILGESSYAVYLLHSPIWFYISHLCPITTIWIWPLYLSTLMICSITVFFVLERPARSAILRLAGIRPAVIQEQEKAASARIS